MNDTQSIKTGLTRIGIWCALVGVTILLTVMFSFLGNLTVAVVSGVVLGSARRWQWNAVPVSLVFPGVIVGLSHYFKNELPPGKVYLVGLVCGAAFWGVYAMAFGLHILEQKAHDQGASKGRVELPGSPWQNENDLTQGFGLGTLRGSWTCEDDAILGSSKHKTLRIENGKFVLSVSDSGGRRREIARGELNVERSGTGQSIVTLNQSSGIKS